MADNHANCGGDCASCGSASCGSACPGGGTLYLTAEEIAILLRFGEIPFWPLCGGPDRTDRQDTSNGPDGAVSPDRADRLSPPDGTDRAALWDGLEPVSPDGFDAASLAALALKGLIRLDWDLPLSNYDYSAFAHCSRCGSMALTAAGQAAVELLEIRGTE